MSRRKEGTRAAYYGIDASALARDAAIKIPKLRAKIAKLQEPWAEVDPMIEQATERVLEALDDLLKQYRESAEYMNEPMND